MGIADDVPLYDATAVPRVLTRDQARRLGYSDDALKHLLATERWQRLLPRTYRTGDTVTWDDRLRAASAYSGDGALISGAAALCHLGLSSVRRPDSILVLVPPGRSRRSTAWVRIRHTDRPMSRAWRSGPALASEQRAIADWALERRYLDDVRALVAEAVKAELCTVDELAIELRQGPRRGSAFLRQAIDEVGAGAWSAPEARAATLLRCAGVPPFEQNARIDLPTGDHLIVDFLWRDLRAVLEIDSDTHHALAGKADRTSHRHVLLETLDYSVVHRTPAYVIRHGSAFVDEVATWLVARAAALGVRASPDR